MDELIGITCLVRIQEPTVVIEKKLTVEAVDFHFIKMNGVWINKSIILSVKVAK